MTNESLLKGKQLLVIGTVWPEPNSSAAGGRMMQLLAFFKSEGMKICFASTAADSLFSIDLQEVEIQKQKILLNDQSFNEFLRSLQPDIVMFDRFMMEEQFGWRVAEECPHALRLLDTEDLHCLRAGREKALKEKRDFTENDLQSDHAKREIASIFRSDLSLIVSTVEMDLLQNYFKVDASLLLHLPFLLEPVSNDEVQQWPTFEHRNNFVFIGNFYHAPNWDAVRYLKTDIWPLIRQQLPTAELHIYGAYPSQKVFDLHNEAQGFLVKGRAINAQEVVKSARISLAPLRFGAGIKGKLVESMQCGTPSVTTTIGAESMHGRLSWNGAIADSPADFAQAAVELFTDKGKWQLAQKKGIQIIASHFSKSEGSDTLKKKIIELVAQLANHRQQNFIGAILLHHLSASTKYLSRWIEIKNLKN